ncbi:hypothetical protein DS745_16250 [Anaerobacillus alkaliphilus]|uniref:Uncharacterized protein n=1 Tax=Anaerobacillus alkaliphilus TaxID=1548597 RepID=A0A4Q0VPQ8_9BACI|nr:hypothetical protein [Anaerobacillus alkaliphilus]RXI97905.1 hypothetical protein DS745_16250 [Anaerobacillus alkaliphilus]
MLNELDGIQLGPIFLSFRILGIGLGVLGAYCFFVLVTKRAFPEGSHKIVNVLQTSGLLFLVIFKLAPLLFQPSYLFQPSKLLIYSGGPYAIELAMLGSISYFGYFFIKEKWSFKLIDFLSIAIYLYLIIHNLTIKEYGLATPFEFGYINNDVLYHPVNLYFLLYYSLFLVTFVSLFIRQRPGVLTISLAAGFLFIQSIIQPFVLS